MPRILIYLFVTILILLIVSGCKKDEPISYICVDLNQDKTIDIENCDFRKVEKLPKTSVSSKYITSSSTKVRKEDVELLSSNYDDSFYIQYSYSEKIIENKARFILQINTPSNSKYYLLFRRGVKQDNSAGIFLSDYIKQKSKGKVSKHLRNIYDKTNIYVNGKLVDDFIKLKNGIYGFNISTDDEINRIDIEEIYLPYKTSKELKD